MIYGIMSIADIEAVMKQYGKPETFEITRIDYRRYKSRTLTNNDKLCELLIYVEKE